MSPGDLRRLQEARAQAASVRDFYVLEVRHLETTLVQRRADLERAIEQHRELEERILAETAPKLGEVS